MKNYNELEWYVLIYNFNSDAIENYNIFNNMNVSSMLNKALKKYDNFMDFKEELCGIFKCAFMNKAEYEIVITGLGERDKHYKVDVYRQIQPNLELVARYIIGVYNKGKRKKIEIE